MLSMPNNWNQLFPGRWEDMGAELLTLMDRQGKSLCLAPVRLS
jgi:prolyl-tRNA synthetase